MKNQQFRQGDVMLERVAMVPKDAKRLEPENGSLIIARGEVTGHCHTVEERGCKMFVGGDGRMYLQTEQETLVTHQEHGSIALPAGIYVYTPQREYHPEEIRRVMD